MRFLRPIAALCALTVLVACSPVSPVELPVSLCHAWADGVNPAPAGTFGFTVSADGVDTTLDLAVGDCADLGPYTAGTEVTIAESLPDGVVATAVVLSTRGADAARVVLLALTPSTTFLVDDVEKVVFENAFDGPASDFTLTEQKAGGVERCCSANWVNPGYEFAGGAPSGGLGGVPGVGGVIATYHSGPASLTDAELAALDAAESPGAAGLAATSVTTAYSALIRVADAFGNSTLQRLVGSGVNPAATFGHDDVAPAQAFAPGSVEDRTIYNANVPGFGAFVAGTIALTVADDTAGFGPAPVATSFRSHNAAEGIICLVGATAACTPTQQPLSFVTDNTNAYPGAGAVTEAYYQYRGQVHDRAGNASGTTGVVTYLFDQTRPNVDNIAGLAGSFLPGQTYTFSASATDNVDLKESAFAFEFRGLTGTNLDAIPVAAPQQLGTPWAFESAATSAPVSATVPFVTGVEPTDGAGSPSGVLVPVSFARFVVTDVAENQSVQRNGFARGTFPAPVSFGAGASPLFPPGATFRQTTPVGSLCVNANAACVGPAARSVTLTATATGPAGTFENPFAQVLFAYVDNIDVGGGEFTHRFIGTDETAVMQDDGPTRTWTWSVTLAAEDLVLDPAGLNYVLPVQAIGINGVTGTALLAVTGTAITVIDN